MILFLFVRSVSVGVLRCGDSYELARSLADVGFASDRSANVSITNSVYVKCSRDTNYVWKLLEGDENSKQVCISSTQFRVA